MSEQAKAAHNLAHEIDEAFARDPWRDQPGMGYVEIQMTRHDAEEWRKAGDRIAELEAQVAALAAALDIARQEIEACRQDVVGTYAEAHFAGVLAEIADPAPIHARVRREAKRQALREWRAKFGYHAPGENTILDKMDAALAALDAEEVNRG